MIPSNLMSFLNKIVENSTSTSSSENDSVCGRIRTTIINAQDMVTASRRNSSSPMSESSTTASSSTLATTVSSEDGRTTTSSSDGSVTRPTSLRDSKPGRPVTKYGSCRVCLKSFKPDDYARICASCKMKVCDDCASYSQPVDTDNEKSWTCSVCRRKQARMAQAVSAQDSQDSLLDVPIIDTLQRRHSDIKIGSSSNKNNMQMQGAGLAPPRSPELRRHSDVSPASLKEIEKVASDKREEMRWERELKWRQSQQKDQQQSPQLSQRSGLSVASHGMSPISSPTRNRKSSTCEFKQNPEILADPIPEEGLSSSKGDPSKSPAAAAALKFRRMSQVPKQRSCDDDNTGKKLGTKLLDTGAGIPRRASAFDVYQGKADAMNSPGSGTSSRRMSCRSTLADVESLNRDSPTSSRRSSYRPPSSSTDSDDTATARRPSFARYSGYEPSSSNDDTLSQDSFSRRGSQMIDINKGRSMNVCSGLLTSRSSISSLDSPSGDALHRQTSLSGEDIKIVIDDVDDKLPEEEEMEEGPIRKVIIKRDRNDRVHKTRGFGMRVVGGKPSPDGTLYAYIVWTAPDGPADRARLRKGDKIIELCGIQLQNLTFDEVSAIMDRTGDVIEMVVETQGAENMRKLTKDEAIAAAAASSARAVQEAQRPSPTRRRLPKTPMELQQSSSSEDTSLSSLLVADSPPRDETDYGRLQLQIGFREKKPTLIVTILAADNLRRRERACEFSFLGSDPQAFVEVGIIPQCESIQSVYTDVAEPTRNPIWNTTLELQVENIEKIFQRGIQFIVWDHRPDGSKFWGSVVLPSLDIAIDQPMWYRIESSQVLARYRKALTNRTKGFDDRFSVTTDSSLPDIFIGSTTASFEDSEESSSLEDTTGHGFLHPDHAYLGDPNSRRGSSQSEQLEVEPYQLNRDFSRSLPGSRRSSFQSGQNIDKDPDIPPIQYSSKGRRRSSCTPRPDPDEILRNLKAVKGELLGRSMSICGDWRGRRRSSERSRKSSSECVPELAENSGEETDTATKSVIPTSTASESKGPPSDDDDGEDPIPYGPSQIEPRYNTAPRAGKIKIKLCIYMTKSQLEVEIICVKGIISMTSPPDTYVKTYLRENERLIQKRKTRVALKSCVPEFNQCVKYNTKDIVDRTLVVMLWERQKGFERNHNLGEAEIRLDKIKPKDTLAGWYPLFPATKVGSESNDSP